MPAASARSDPRARRDRPLPLRDGPGATSRELAIAEVAPGFFSHLRCLMPFESPPRFDDRDGVDRPGLLPSAGLLAQGDYGSIKGRLVWGGAEVPVRKFLVEQGKAAKDPEVCGKDAPIVESRAGGRPQDQGHRHTRSSTWSSPRARTPRRSRPAGQEPQGRARPEELRVPPLRPGDPPGPDPGDQVERPGQPQRPVRGLHERGFQPDPGAEGRAGSQARRRAAADPRGLRYSLLDEGLPHGLRPSVLRGHRTRTARSRSRASPPASRTWWSGRRRSATSTRRRRRGLP